MKAPFIRKLSSISNDGRSEEEASVQQEQDLYTLHLYCIAAGCLLLLFLGISPGAAF